jgi:hypothetical protein
MLIKMKNKLLLLAMGIVLSAQTVKSQETNTENSALLQTTKTVVGYLQSGINPQYQGIGDNTIWHYIAVTKSGLNGKIYLDGNLLSESTYVNNPYIWNSLLLGATQGCVNCTPVADYFGQIDDLRISNIERSSTQIANYYNSNQPFESDLNTIGLYNFDTTNGAVLQNSGSGNNGTLYGGVGYAAGKFGQAINFDGVDDYARISQSLPTNVITIEFWFKSTDTSATMAMFEYAYNTGIYLQTFGDSCENISGSLTSGLVGYWPFCGNANDESGNGNNGTVNGATLTADRYGITNKAYDFNGSTNYIEVPSSNSLSNISEITVSAWVYIDSWFQSGGDGYFPIIHKSNLQGQYGKYALTLKSLGGISHLNSQENGFGFNNWSLGVWQHVVMIFSNNRNKIYVDGDLISDVPTGVFPNSFNNSLPLVIGMDKPGFVEYSNGKIDDLCIWNRALTPQEISNLYNNNLSSGEFTVEKNEVSIYPNPASTHININFNNFTDLNEGTIKIINSLGQEISSTPITISGTNSSMQLSSWGETGLYFVQIINPQGQIVDIKKIILQ